MPSYYPDGTTRVVHGLVDRVAPPQSQEISPTIPKVARREVYKIMSHRIIRVKTSPTEEYLVKWRVPQQAKIIKPMSWHDLDELRDCLPKVQKYIDRLSPETSTSTPSKSLKRRSPAYDDDSRILQPPLLGDESGFVESKNVYNGTLEIKNGILTVRALQSVDGASKLATARDLVPMDAIKARANRVGDRLPQAKERIRSEFNRQIAESNASRPDTIARLSLVNEVDDTTPPLGFRFIYDYLFGQGTQKMDPGTLVGCGTKHAWSNHRCNPNMGKYIGCEYSRVCDCMEYAEVDTNRLKPEEKIWMQEHPGEPKLDLPKRFPYFTSGAKEGCLVPFYLDKRSPIYECNINCDCGPDCRNRLVQRGRRVPLEIFKTSDGRGWGLRCLVDLRAGDFIDTYLGEVITATEADEREKKNKSASYLFTLDKFAGEEQALDECYVVDGEYVGGPTRFINHSCEPNCQQHTVSLNKFDRRVYMLAFFANQRIEAGTELTFDYLDKDGEVEDIGDPQEGKTRPCHCGSTTCRGRLWI